MATISSASFWNSNPLHDSLTMDEDPVHSIKSPDAKSTPLKIDQIQAINLLNDLKSPNFKSVCKTMEVVLNLDRTLFLGGEAVTGNLVIDCKHSKKVLLGKICVDIYGIEGQSPGIKMKWQIRELNCPYEIRNPTRKNHSKQIVLLCLSSHPESRNCAL